MFWVLGLGKVKGTYVYHKIYIQYAFLYSDMYMLMLYYTEVRRPIDIMIDIVHRNLSINRIRDPVLRTYNWVKGP